MPLQRSPTKLTNSENDLRTAALPNLQSQESCSSPNISTRNKKRRLSDDDSEDMLVSFKDDIKKMLSDMLSQQNTRLNALEKHMIDTIEKNNQEMGNTLNFMSEQITAIQSQITSLEQEKKSTSLEISILSDKIDNMERNLRKTCLEIRYIPRKQKETKSDLFEMIQNLLKQLKLENLNPQVRDVYRLPKKNDKNNATTVIFEMSSTLARSTIIEHIKKFNRQHSTEQLSTTHLGIDTARLPIFVSEHLTPKNTRIHFLARDFARTENYKFCWVSNGNIFLRKDEHSPHILVKNEDVLKSIKDKRQNE